MTEQIEGRPLSEIRAIVAADNARLQRILDIWSELTEEQQEALVADAEATHSENELDET